MSETDSNRPAEERIQQALATGPDIAAPGRYGAATRFARRLVGRAVKYERDYGLQIDMALLDRLHELEATMNERVRVVETEMRASDAHLHDYADRLMDNDHRAQRDTAGALSRIEALESALSDSAARMQEVDARAAVATTMAAGATESLDALMRERELTTQSLDALARETAQLRSEIDSLRELVAQLRDATIVLNDVDHQHS